MKILIVYYSRTGTTKRMGEEIASMLEAETDEIIDHKNRKGKIAHFKATVDARREKLTDITVQKSPYDYDAIIIGTPIWAGKMTPAVRTFLTKYQFSDKKRARVLSTLNCLNCRGYVLPSIHPR